MKATTWLCPVFTLLCATKLVYTAQRESYGGYAFDDIGSQKLQNDYFRSKRNKPSLSIVNPLDVLRQRLLLEIARRQMKENSRQVELNRAILKNVGKRMASKYSSPLTAALYDVNESQQQRQQQQQQQQQMQQDLLQHLPANYEYELIPTTLIFDYLQKQQQQKQQQQQQQQQLGEQSHYSWLPYAANALQFDNNYINDAIDGSSNGQLDNSDEDDAVQNEVLAINGLLGSSDGHAFKHLKQTNNEHSNTANEQQQQKQQQHDKTTFQKSINNRADDDTKRLTMIKNHQSHHQNSQSLGNSNSNNNLNLDLNDANPALKSSLNANANDFKNEMNVNGAGDYQIQRYLYHLH